MIRTNESRTVVVDLTSRDIRHIDIPPAWVEGLLGGRGIASKLLWDLVPPGADPLGPENVLIFSSGPLAGTSAPTAGRAIVTTKGPQTGVYLKTSFGGHFGAAMRYAGIDTLVIQGAASEPVWLRIDASGVRVEDASHLWGLGVRETTRTLSGTQEGVEVACIGPAGEHLVRIACIIGSYYCSASRGGAGAVMGSKRLKAIAVDPSGGWVDVADPEAFGAVVAEARDAIYEDTLARQLFESGTAADVDFFNEMHTHPAFNFRRSTIDDPEGAQRLSGRNWLPNGYLKHRRGCSGCVISCLRYTEVDDGRYAGTYSGGPQLESVNALGPRCGNTDAELVFRLNELCNDLGLDVSSTGSAISWLMESYERGVLPEESLEGLRPEWGDADVMLELVDRIAHRRGVGDMLADGTREAAKRVGGDAWKWTMHGGKGLEITAVELRAAYSYALAYAVNVRGADHLLTETIAEFGGTREARAVMDRITGDAARYCGGSILEKRAEIVRWHEDIYAVTDSLGICAFSTTAAYGVNEERAARLFSAATGIPKTAAEIMEAGRRVVTLERCFNMREGLDRRHDTLPWRVMNEVQTDVEPELDPIVSQAKLDTMLDEYYRLHEWSLDTGNPTDTTLKRLGLESLLHEGESGLS